MKLSIHLVVWNGAKYIPYLFKSLWEQTFKDYFLRIFDNASGDGTVEAIKKELNNFSVQYELIKNEENLGFAGGHNKLISKGQISPTERGIPYVSGTISNYLLLLNQDIYLESDCLEKLVDFMDGHPEAAAAAPRLMKWNHESLTANSRESMKRSFTNQIDSLGLRVFRNRRVVEIGAGKEWRPESTAISNNREVFGVSGALPLFRREALEAVKFADGGGEIFDSFYHSYKEDVDLAFRLQSAGFKSCVVLDAVAYHDRSSAGPKDLSEAAAVKNKKKQSQRVRYHSYKNHLMTIYKNEYGQNFWLDCPWILWYELKKFVYFLFFDRQVLGGLVYIWRHRGELKRRRKEIRDKRKIGWKEMRRRLLEN